MNPKGFKTLDESELLAVDGGIIPVMAVIGGVAAVAGLFYPGIQIGQVLGEKGEKFYA